MVFDMIEKDRDYLFLLNEKLKYMFSHLEEEENFSEEISRIDSIVEIVNSDALANRENSRVPDILPEVLLFKSNEHQRYENGEPVEGFLPNMPTHFMLIPKTPDGFVWPYNKE